MAIKAMTLVGLDVHARQTHAAVLVPETGEVRVSGLQMAPVEVVSFLEGFDGVVRAVYVSRADFDRHRVWWFPLFID
ncbi:MAG: hypothetical protein JWN32_1927 [Solirubrobacterales bacterium]|nr:hypothetical protein [Solirubrobacterales bacterium]